MTYFIGMQLILRDLAKSKNLIIISKILNLNLNIIEKDNKLESQDLIAIHTLNRWVTGTNSSDLFKSPNQGLMLLIKVQWLFTTYLAKKLLIYL